MTGDQWAARLEVRGAGSPSEADELGACSIDGPLLFRLEQEARPSWAIEYSKYYSSKF